MKPKIPQGRDECSMEQLIEIQRIIGEKSDEGKLMRNLALWLMLSGHLI